MKAEGFCWRGNCFMETSTFQVHDFENEDTAEGEKVGWDESSKANIAKPIFRCIMTAESSRGLINYRWYLADHSLIIQILILISLFGSNFVYCAHDSHCLRITRRSKINYDCKVFSFSTNTDILVSNWSVLRIEVFVWSMNGPQGTNNNWSNNTPGWFNKASTLGDRGICKRMSHDVSNRVA